MKLMKNLKLTFAFFGAVAFLTCNQAQAAAAVVVGYIQDANWGSVSGSIPWADVSHLNDAFGGVNGATASAPANGAAMLAAAHSHSVKCYISFGGAGVATWPTSTAQATSLGTAIANLINSGGYDGADIDWEWPTGGQQPILDALLTSLHTGLAGKGLTMYLMPGSNTCGYDFTTSNNLVDWYTVPGYDMNINVVGDEWQGALNEPNGSTFTQANGCNPNVGFLNSYSIIANWYNTNTNKSPNTAASVGTVPYSKMVMGMPFYGRNSGGSGFTTDVAAFAGGTGTYDATRCEANIGGYGMDTDQSFCDKMNWAFAKGFLGVAIWELSQGLPSTSSATMTNIWTRLGAAKAGTTSGCLTTTVCGAACAVTPTPSPGCGVLVTNFENSNNANYLGYADTFATAGGACNTMTPANNTFVSNMNSGLNGSRYGANWNGTITTVNTIGGACWGPYLLVGLAPPAAGSGYNAQSTNASINAVQFSINVASGPSPCTVAFGMESFPGTGTQFNTNVVVTTGSTTTITIPFSQLQQQPAGSATFNPQNLYQMYWVPMWTGAYNLTIDDVWFVCSSANTPTFTKTNTPTNTLTPTLTKTNTPVPPTNTFTRTNTPTLTNTNTPVPPTSTFTPTRTNTNTNTPVPPTNTFTRTNTPTITNTNTPVPPTNTFTSTRTNTPTNTNTPIAPTNTFTLTNTRTNTPSPTNTNTPAPPTSSFTPTNTRTFTNTNTPAPPTNTPTITHTNTNTPVPPTNTFTSTKTNTPTSTNTNTPAPPTNTFTVTNTRTNTNTPVPPTSTFTSTNTRTFTNTNTPAPPTNTFTATVTPTLTFTGQPTATNTNTPLPPTNTFTSTKTNTPTSTNTNTPVPPTNTSTNTSTKTNTPTSTNTPVPPTSTFTPTVTNTGTSTFTPTNSFTGTLSPTATFTNTNSPTKTFTSTSTSTSTSTLTSTSTSTSTFTAVSTATFTNTSTRTFTPTPTSTSTSTATATYTATQPMVQVSLGASLPATQVVGGASNVPVLELNVSNQSGETVQLTGTTLTAGGTASSATGVASLAVYQVVGGNPVLLETILNPFASSNTPTIPLPSLNVPAGSTQTYLITYTFGSGAQAGSYTVGVINGNDLTGHGLTSGKGLNVTGAPVNGAVVTLAVSTATSTSTSTVTTTATVTATGTPTKTKTPSTAKTPIIYPNPSTGDPISIYVPGNGIAHVKVEIFTTAFRKVQEANFDNIPLGVMGSAPRVPMTDKSGDLLASGLYYVVITTAPTTSTGGGAQRLVGKFLLLK